MPFSFGCLTQKKKTNGKENLLHFISEGQWRPDNKIRSNQFNEYTIVAAKAKGH